MPRTGRWGEWAGEWEEEEDGSPPFSHSTHLPQVQAGAEALSGVYAVLGRRRARILSEEVRGRACDQ